MSVGDAKETLWQAIVERAEALHDAAVLGQRRAHTTTAKKLATSALDIASLAHSASVLTVPSRRRR